MNHWLGQEVPGMLRDSQKESVNMSEQRTRTEEFQVSGDKLIEKIKEIIHSQHLNHLSRTFLTQEHRLPPLLFLRQKSLVSS